MKSTDERALYERMEVTTAHTQRNARGYALAETLVVLLVAAMFCALLLLVNALIPKGNGW